MASLASLRDSSSKPCILEYTDDRERMSCTRDALGRFLASSCVGRGVRARRISLRRKCMLTSAHMRMASSYLLSAQAAFIALCASFVRFDAACSPSSLTIARLPPAPAMSAAGQL